jgi:hypothetical protein
MLHEPKVIAAVSIPPTFSLCEWLGLAMPLSRHSGESRNPAFLDAWEERHLGLDPGFRRDDGLRATQQPIRPNPPLEEEG